MRSVRRAVATCLCAFARALAAFATRRAGGPWYCARLLAVERVRRRHPHLSRRGFSKPPPQPIAVLTRLSYNGFFFPPTRLPSPCASPPRARPPPPLHAASRPPPPPRSRAASSTASSAPPRGLLPRRHRLCCGAASSSTRWRYARYQRLCPAVPLLPPPFRL